MTIPRVIGFAAVAATVLVGSPFAQAQNAPAAKPMVIVPRPIDGKSFRANGQWHRLEVELKLQQDAMKAALVAKGIADSHANAVRWLNNVKVTLLVGYSPTGADLGKPKVYQDLLRLKDDVAGGKSIEKTRDASNPENWRFYKASATVLTLEAGAPKSVFFYIPADIVKRDGIVNPRPDVAVASLEVDGVEVPLLDAAGHLPTGSFAAMIAKGKVDAPALEKVREVGERGSRDTAGIMRPQNFINCFIDPDWKSSPEFVREDSVK